MSSEHTVQVVRDAMNSFVSPAWCAGIATAPSLEVRVPGQAGCPTRDPATLVEWLSARSEPAPFGVRGETKLDNTVRSTLRLKARGQTEISGLDVGAIVERIEAEFASTTR